ncbi:MAG: hypothetical protein Q7T63_21370 [Burkholderiaceae bacterium]|nr:hypothetical protein [Burkholderiaceae bacterium]MDO9089037.1 hypothetical protein [Burkholderiaceae bacterium]
MKTSPYLKTSLAVAAALLLSVVQAAAMTKAEYDAAKTRISADYKVDKTACSSFASNARDICKKEAEGKEKIARAELKANYSGKPADQTDVRVVMAKAAYGIAREKCDDKSGNDKNVCVKEAKATETRELANAKMGQKIGEARKEASDDKRDANYKVAIEKCDALAGDAKASCVASAKAEFGKS